MQQCTLLVDGRYVASIKDTSSLSYTSPNVTKTVAATCGAVKTTAHVRAWLPSFTQDLFEGTESVKLGFNSIGTQQTVSIGGKTHLTTKNYLDIPLEEGKYTAVLKTINTNPIITDVASVVIQ